MSSKVSRIHKVYQESKNNPITVSYALVIHHKSEHYACIITPFEWGFIDEGIVNATIKNILAKKGIYLEYSHDLMDYLSMTPTERAFAISEKTFNSQDELISYAQKNHIEIKDTLELYIE